MGMLAPGLTPVGGSAALSASLRPVEFWGRNSPPAVFRQVVAASLHSFLPAGGGDQRGSVCQVISALRRITLLKPLLPGFPPDASLSGWWTPRSPAGQPTSSCPHCHLLSPGRGPGAFLGGHTCASLPRPPANEGSSPGCTASGKKGLGSCSHSGPWWGGVHWGAWPRTPTHAVSKPKHPPDTAVSPQLGHGLGRPTRSWPSRGFGPFSPRARPAEVGTRARSPGPPLCTGCSEMGGRGGGGR